MRDYLEQTIGELNTQHGLEIELDAIAEIYGEDIVDRMAEYAEEVIANIEYLLSLGFAETVSDICNRYGISLLEDNHIFRSNVDALITGLGKSYTEQLAEDVSYWEQLL